MPRLDRDRRTRLDPIPGNPPSLINLPSGCVFNPRCTFQHLVGKRCVTERPEMVSVGGGHGVRCHIPHEQRQQVWRDEVRPLL
jgi:peptide/nickel transport system ATP-binding protein